MQEIELVEPGRGEALARIAAAGVCHTDAITRAGDESCFIPGPWGAHVIACLRRTGQPSARAACSSASVAH